MFSSSLLDSRSGVWASGDGMGEVVLRSSCEFAVKVLILVLDIGPDRVVRERLFLRGGVIFHTPGDFDSAGFGVFFPAPLRVARLELILQK